MRSCFMDFKPFFSAVVFGYSITVLLRKRFVGCIVSFGSFPGCRSANKRKANVSAQLQSVSVGHGNVATVGASILRIVYAATVPFVIIPFQVVEYHEAHHRARLKFGVRIVLVHLRFSRFVQWFFLPNNFSAVDFAILIDFNFRILLLVPPHA